MGHILTRHRKNGALLLQIIFVVVSPEDKWKIGEDKIHEGLYSFPCLEIGKYNDKDILYT